MDALNRAIIHWEDAIERIDELETDDDDVCKIFQLNMLNTHINFKISSAMQFRVDNQHFSMADPQDN